MEESYNQSIGEWTNYRLGKNGKTYEKCEEKISSLGGKLFKDGIAHKSSDEQSELEPIVKAINNKIGKLHFYREKFKECSLAIILEHPIFSVYKKAIDYFDLVQSKSNVKFDSLIIVSCKKIFIYDYKSKIIFEQSITKEEYRCLSNIGVMIVNKLIPSINDCFISQSKQREIDCFENFKSVLSKSSKFSIEKNNGDLDLLNKVFNKTKPNENETVFPDFVFKKGLVEHFIVTSSKENRHGSSYKKYENKIKKQQKAYFEQKDNEFFNCSHQTNTFTCSSVNNVFEDYSYDDFISSFKKHFDDHYSSLIRSKLNDDFVIFLIDYQGGRLCVYENNSFDKFYNISDDRKILCYLKSKHPAINYVLFKSCDAFEIIDLSKIDDLIETSKDDLDVRGGRMINHSIKIYIDI